MLAFVYTCWHTSTYPYTITRMSTQHINMSVTFFGQVFGALLQSLLKIKIRSPKRPHTRNYIYAPTIPIQTNRFDALAPNSNTNTPASQKHNKTHTPIFETPTRDLTQISKNKTKPKISAESPEVKSPWKISKPVDSLVSSLVFPL